MTSIVSRIKLTSAVVLLVAACGGPTEQPEPGLATNGDSKTDNATLAQPNPLREAYFGETHMHTAYSLDAYIGGTRLTPADAYRFAKGETVTVDGEPHNRHRPLDFVAVSDHAEYIGEMYSTMVEGAPGHDQELLEELRNLQTLKEKQQWFLEFVVENNRGTTPQHPPFFMGPETTRSAWQVAIDAAEENNEPGRFTAFVAFEWSGAPNGGNLHRNVIFRDAHGVKALAIPHNSNAGKQMMFAKVDGNGDSIDLEYAQKRQHFEPLIEMMQIKGNSEVHRKFWPADEFADFENADSIQKYSDRTFQKKDFVREGLKMGVAFEQQLGANPFKYGIIGGTDNHNGVPSDVAENSFVGGHGPEDGTVEARRSGGVGGWIDGKDLSIGSLAAVWATENTRAAIWDAMKRRETFATSGPRIRVRFFGGVDLPAEPADAEEMVRQGYELGVAMGSDLGPTGAPPTFTVYAMKDPDGANLDRIQIIKGWVDADGDTHEEIVDVAWSGERQPGADGRVPAVGSTVDLTTAKFTNTIGAATLMGSWIDETFESEQHTFYYARALEIPTPRWSTYDAVRHSLPLLEDVLATIQERAWTSPIWYTP
jgi:hypothetical protein